jgi:transcriptional regulator with XRE-family HTH domain
VTHISDLHHQWLQDPSYREAYDALSGEFSLAELVIRARTEAGFSQAELAKRIDTTQSVIARLEGGHSKPSTRTLEKIAKATGTRLKISFEPVRGDASRLADIR